MTTDHSQVVSMLSVPAGLHLSAGITFPGNKSKMLIYGCTAERFKLKPRGRTSLPRTEGFNTGPGDTHTLTQVRHIFRFVFCLVFLVFWWNESRFQYLFLIIYKIISAATTQSKHDSFLHAGGGQRQVWWLLQAPVPVEGEHLQAALQRAPGVLRGLSIFQCVL